MRAVIQRADQASVKVKGDTVGSIHYGLVVLLGVTHDDTAEDVTYLVNKIVNLRIFEDDNGKMNFSIKDTGGGILSISQFTLYGDTRKGRRPSFIKSASPELANRLYEMFNQKVNDEDVQLDTGQFGEMMDVRFTNVGPVTLILDSKDR